MPLHRQIEAAQPVSGERICSALHQDGFGLEHIENLFNDGLENVLILFIIHALTQWEIYAVVGPFAFSDVVYVPGSWEVVLELVERAGEHSVCDVKGFFNPVSVVNIDIDIANSLVGFQQLQYSEDTIVRVAKARCLALLGMVQAADPIYSILDLLFSNQAGRRN